MCLKTCTMSKKNDKCHDVATAEPPWKYARSNKLSSWTWPSAMWLYVFMLCLVSSWLSKWWYSRNSMCLPYRALESDNFVLWSMGMEAKEILAKWKRKLEVSRIRLLFRIIGYPNFVFIYCTFTVLHLIQIKRFGTQHFIF